MTQKLLYTFILVALLAGCKNDKTSADKTKEEKQQTIIEEYFFPPEIKYYSPNQNYYIDKFFPIGWSDDGNFAYICEPDAEAMNNYVMEIYVINVLNLDTLWSWHSDYNDETVREEVWKKNYKFFKEKLNSFKIVQLKEPKLLSPYFTAAGNDYVLELEDQAPEAPGSGFNPVRWSKLKLKSPQLGEKIICDYDFGPNSIIIGESLAGVMLSPNSQYIAAIIQMERPGYEGPPNIITFRIAGGNLNTGFKQVQ